MTERKDPKMGSVVSLVETDGAVTNNLKKEKMEQYVDLLQRVQSEGAFSVEDAKAAVVEYFGGDELAAQVWVNRHAMMDCCGNVEECVSDDCHWRLKNEIERSCSGRVNSLPLNELEILYLLGLGGKKAKKAQRARMSRYLGPINAVNPKPVGDPVGLEYVYKMATSDAQLERMCDALRRETDKSIRDGIKKGFPYVTHGCVCSSRGEEGVIELSNIFCIDFDNVVKPYELKQVLLSDPYFETQLAMISPGGHGVKWFVYYPFMDNKAIADEMLQKDCSVAEVYKFVYESMANCLEATYDGYYVDLNAKDIARATFLSSDKEAYINPLLIGGEPNVYNCLRREEFDVKCWCRVVTQAKNVTVSAQTQGVAYTSTIDGGYIWTDSDSDEAHVEAAVRYLEEHCVDITSDYNVWCNIGFAFVNSFGFGGRKYYHRVSSFYLGYTYSETEKKYDNLLVTTRNNIGIATFFKYFTDATGMKVATKREEYSITIENITEERLDFCFASKLNGNLPEFFRKMDTLGQTERAKDVVLMCSLVATGATMHRVKTWHYDKWVSPFLYFGVIAESGAGKSTMDYARKLLTSIERDNKVESGKIQSEYNTRKNNAGRWFNEKRPSKKGLVIGGDFSDIAIKRRLVMNDEVALIYEAEAEQMMNAFNKTDWGLFTTTLKKAFDHEWIEANRGTDNETLELEHPKIAVLLSGTKEQFGPFMENYTTGLGSRFLWYDFDGKMPKHDVAGEGLNIGVLEELSDTVYAMYKMLSKRDEDLIVKFKDKKQIERHNAFFDASEGYLGGRGGEFYKGLIQRSSSMAHRIMVVLSVFRAYESGVDLSKVSSLEIEDVDFESSLEIIDMMIENTIEVTDKLCRLEEQKAQYRWNKGACVNKSAKRQDLFYSQLPKNIEFDRKLALEIGAQCKIPKSTVDKYLKNGIGSILQDMGHGKYIKPMV